MLESQQLEELRSTATAGPNRLSAAIKLAGVTQRDVARAVDMTEPHLSDVCRGRVKEVSLTTAHKLASYFGCQIEDLFPARQSEPAEPSAIEVPGVSVELKPDRRTGADRREGVA